jgi:hypothetical protein
LRINFVCEECTTRREPWETVGKNEFSYNYFGKELEVFSKN